MSACVAGQNGGHLLGEARESPPWGRWAAQKSHLVFDFCSEWNGSYRKVVNNVAVQIQAVFQEKRPGSL